VGIALGQRAARVQDLGARDADIGDRHLKDGRDPGGGGGGRAAGEILAIRAVGRTTVDVGVYEAWEDPEPFRVEHLHYAVDREASWDRQLCHTPVDDPDVGGATPMLIDERPVDDD